MARLRWGPKGEQTCPTCGLVEKHYWRPTRKQWRCRDQACRRDFSVTSGTIFHGHKLSIREILMALFRFINSTKGVSAAELARELGCEWKSAWLLLQKIREGARRTLIYITRTENQHDVMWFARNHIAPGSIIMTDEGLAFNELSRLFDHKTVKHKHRYVGVNGTNGNQAESFYSRLRRSQYGTHHGFRPKYLMDYAVESAWREDSRKASMLDRFEGLLCEVLRMGRSTWFGKYFQGMRRIEIQGIADGRRFTGPHAEEVAMHRDELKQRERLLGGPLIARGDAP